MYKLAAFLIIAAFGRAQAAQEHGPLQSDEHTYSPSQLIKMAEGIERHGCEAVPVGATNLDLAALPSNLSSALKARGILNLRAEAAKGQPLRFPAWAEPCALGDFGPGWCVLFVWQRGGKFAVGTQAGARVNLTPVLGYEMTADGKLTEAFVLMRSWKPCTDAAAFLGHSSPKTSGTPTQQKN